MDNPSVSSKTRRATNILVAAVMIAILVVVGELALRVFFPIRYSMDIQYVNDGHVGWRLEPNHAYVLAEGGVCSVNNLGFRGAEDTMVPKPDGIVRVVVLGGSAVFCFEVDDADAWTALLEDKLRARYGNHIEVVNAGVPGYDAFISKMNYLYRIRPLEPDIVIVSHTWNDLKRLREIESGAFPRADLPPPPNPVRKFFRHFQLAWRARVLWQRVAGDDRRENTWDRGVAGPEHIPDGGRAHRWVRRNYDDLALLTESDGVRPVFASQAGLISESVIRDPEARVRIRNDYAFLSLEETLKQWRAISGIIERSAWDNGVLFVDEYGSVPHDPDLFHDHVHLTEEGNRRVAEVMFEAMVSDPLIDDELTR